MIRELSLDGARMLRQNGRLRKLSSNACPPSKKRNSVRQKRPRLKQNSRLLPVSWIGFLLAPRSAWPRPLYDGYMSARNDM